MDICGFFRPLSLLLILLNPGFTSEQPFPDDHLLANRCCGGMDESKSASILDGLSKLSISWGSELLIALHLVDHYKEFL